jgi:serine/threonine protein kinase
MEYVSGGSIKSLINKYGQLEERVVIPYMRQALKGLAFLHFHGIIHKDIKGSNLLLDSHGKVKLSDYACCRIPDEVPEDKGELSQYIKSSPYWLAPEVVNHQAQGRPSDIWSMGCLLIEMLTGKPPWTDVASKPEEAFKLIQSKSNDREYKLSSSTTKIS